MAGKEGLATTQDWGPLGDSGAQNLQEVPGRRGIPSGEPAGACWGPAPPLLWFQELAEAEGGVLAAVSSTQALTVEGVCVDVIQAALSERIDLGEPCFVGGWAVPFTSHSQSCEVWSELLAL